MSKEFIEKISSSLKPAEKSKILQELINKVNENDVNNVLSECKNLPSFQYNWLKLAFANKFQRFDLALELLQNEEKSILSKTAKKSWLYDSNNQLGNSDYLLNEFFPSVSLCCRRKVINNIALYIKNEQQVTKIFDVVEKKYGFNAAVPLIASCTKEKIQLILLERKFILKSRQIRRIIEKFPDVGLQYLKDRYPNLTKCEELQYQSTLNYLYKNYPNDFIQLFIAYHKKMPGFKIGRCRSKKMIQKFRPEILENSTLANILHITELRKEFQREEFMSLFESTFPKHIDYIHQETFWKWLNTFQKDERLNIIKSVYMKLYKINLDDHPEYIDADILLLLPVNKRLSLIEWKIKNDIPVKTHNFANMFMNLDNTYDSFIVWSIFKPTEYSIPELEKALSVEQDVGNRASLSKCLLVTCCVNNDPTKLLYVLNLLSRTSRTDSMDVRSLILYGITNIMQNMKFTEDHWSIILEMVKASLVFDYHENCCKTNHTKIGEKCLSSQMKSKKLFEAIFSFLLIVKVQTENWTWTNIKNKDEGNALFEFYVRELEFLYSSKSSNRNDCYANKLDELSFELIHHICKFNRQQRKSSIHLKCISLIDNDWIKKNIQQILESRINVDKNKEFYEIIRELRNEQRESLNLSHVWDDLFSKVLITAPTEAVVIHYLIENPSKLDDSWSIILPKMLDKMIFYRFIHIIRSCNYSSLRSQSIKICTEMIDSKEATYRQKCNSIFVLSMLCESDAFVSLESKFCLVATRQNYELRHKFVKYLTRVNSSHSALSVIEKWCNDCPLKLIVGSLWSHLIRIPETKALEFLRPRLYNSPVSLQKHIMRLFFEIGTLNDQMEVIKNMDNNNVRIRHKLFLRAKDVFIVNPSKKTWNLLKTHLEKVSTNDVATLQNIYSKHRIHQISKEYISDYLLLCLAALKKTKVVYVPQRKNEKKKVFVNDFVDNINDEIDNLGEDVLDQIVLNHNTNDSFNAKFLIRYLVKSQTLENCNHRISNVKSCLKEVIPKFLGKMTPKQLAEKTNYVTRHTVFQFINNLCNEILKATLGNDLKKKILEDLSSLSDEFLSVFFEEMFTMKLALLLIPIANEEPAKKLKSFGRSLGQLIDHSTEIYGTEINPIIYRVVQSFITLCLSTELGEDKEITVEIVDGILETGVSKSSRIVCSYFLHNMYPKLVNLKAKYDRLKESLKNSDDVVIRIFYHY